MKIVRNSQSHYCKVLQLPNQTAFSVCNSPKTTKNVFLKVFNKTGYSDTTPLNMAPTETRLVCNFQDKLQVEIIHEYAQKLNMREFCMNVLQLV